MKEILEPIDLKKEVKLDLKKTKEFQFLEGPQSRKSEFLFLIKVVIEFIKGFRTLHFVGPCVTVYGSARFTESHPSYRQAMQMGAILTKLGYTVMTGGGGGIMEAANRGAKEANGKSIGCNIVLPHEQKPNKYLDKWVNINYFFVRKILLTKYSYAFIVFPGGMGTMDEFFEIITLIQTHKMKSFPVVIIGKEYYHDLYKMINSMCEAGAISEKDMQLFLFTDSVADAANHIQYYSEVNSISKRPKVFKISKWLGEK